MVNRHRVKSIGADRAAQCLAIPDVEGLNDLYAPATTIVAARERAYATKTAVARGGDPPAMQAASITQIAGVAV